MEGKILNLNQRVLELLDCYPEQLYGADFCDVVGMGHQECRTAIQQIREGQCHGIEMSLEIRTPFRFDVESELHILETTMTRVDYGGREAIQWVGHDISERVALERMRDDLTHMIVHDLRNPLGSVMSSLQLMHTAFLEHDQAVPMLQLLGIAMRSGQKLYRLIDSLLDLGRMEAGETKLNKTLERPELLVLEAIDQVQPLVLSRDQTLTTQIMPGLPQVLVDRELILRVLTNLMDNAIKFTSYGGRITVEVEHVQGDVRFAVRDTGLGIPRESRQRIFDRFARLESAEGVKGTGIGLAFCKLAVEAHKGRIWVESEEEHGATFYFTLPLEVE
jgi:signal transduction histidine kinase